LNQDGGEQRLLEEIEKDIAEGADNVPLRYFDFDRFGAGEIFRNIRITKGLEKTTLIPIERRRWLPVDAFPAGLDWYEVEERFLLRRFRWSGPNPNPRYLLNVRVAGSIQLRIRVLAFADVDLAESLKLDVDGNDVAFAYDRNVGGEHILAIDPIPGPIGNGLVLRFRLPHCVRLRSDPRQRRAGLALSGIEVTPLP
jgi:hypothetical protein